ncbi:hypothetical protein AB0M54_39270 [Actinoplanes sp. NPDC051470]|uniref:hypothetical protein n=1 Tax=Actinoplanes sp. NPDC051470 TaxID=3157224 RepID=UPI003437E0BC
MAGPDLAYRPDLAAVARDLDIDVSIDAVFGQASSQAILGWEKQGLLGPGLSLIHATGLTPESWRAIGATGTTISLAPTSDTQIGLECLASSTSAYLVTRLHRSPYTDSDPSRFQLP